ncbi:class I SAM-dependent methyltransferase [bacterium SCSIO 12696]|nr:class I SAM-dependent methyltransferase [bacterium SCSIO 12696]
MTNPNFQQLLNELCQTNGPALLIVDENLPDAPFAALANSNTNIRLLTNRYDIWQQAQAAGLSTHFNDFDTSIFQIGHFEKIVYRISKEKPVVHHLINSAFDLLAQGGELILGGEKNDGIKTYAKKAGSYFQVAPHIEKNGNNYTVYIRKESNDFSSKLDDKNYTQLRPTIQIDDTTLFSKPGVFGWEKVDRGSAFLVEHLPQFLKHLPENASLLDLGCGYGYITACAQRYGFSRTVATDNNAAALAACKRNFEESGINGEVIAGDAGINIEERFNIVLCNPPFHQGFATDGRLTDKFLTTTKRVLRRSGKALFVVNSFVPLPQKAEKIFNSVEVVAENRSFKLVVVS